MVKSLMIDGLQEVMKAVAECVTAEPVTVEPLKALKSFRACRGLELRDALELQGQINAGLRERLSVLRAGLDIARAEAKEQKRQYPYPRNRSTGNSDR